ncbi:uncharacterized protein LOC131878917 [Tigriopus californicus]|uniref:uncharacterized protein LOC131878917 n=1 Tax=Tigriopus californicus TaxID=6832 RepID=UPI0027DA68F5|nr:uncharacterized protein LOC131878917 [Tigriopus californicus]
MAILSSCLCGSVETGSRLIALLSCINAAYMTVAPFDLKDKLDQFCLHANNSSIYCHYSQEDVYNKLLFMKVFWLSCSLLSSVLLVLGIHCRNRFLLLPWIFWNGFLTCVFLFLVTPSRSQGSLLTLVFFAWTELCVISHFQNLRDENERPRTATHPPNTHPIDAPESFMEGQSDVLHSGYPHSPPVTTQPPPYEECSAEGGLANSFAKRETPPPSYQECSTFYQESETPAPPHQSPGTPKSDSQPSDHEATPETRQSEGRPADNATSDEADKSTRK